MTDGVHDGVFDQLSQVPADRQQRAAETGAGFRFKGKAWEPPATGVQSALALRFDSNFPFKDSTCTIYLVQQKYAAWSLGEKGKVWAATGVRSEFTL